MFEQRAAIKLSPGAVPKGTEWWKQPNPRTMRVHLSARMVFCAQRNNALMDRIPRSTYAKGRARGLLSIGGWGTSLLID